MKKPEKILIVDDEIWICTLLQDFLKEEGFDVDVAENITQARESLTKNSIPDLVVLDVMLPDGNGFHFLEEIRKHPQWEDLPVIMISAHRTDTQDKVVGLEKGADDYLVKPFDLKEFRSRVERILTRIRKIKKLSKLKPSPVVPPSLPSGQKVEVSLSQFLGQFQKPSPVASKAPEPHKPFVPMPQIPLTRSFWQLLLDPASYLSRITPISSLHLVYLIFGAFFMGKGVQWGLEQKSFAVGLVGGAVNLAMMAGLVSLGAWVVQWVMGLNQKPVAYKNLFVAFGLSGAPLAFASWLGMIYVGLSGGNPGDFTAGPLLIFPTQSTSTALGFWLRHLDLFEIWSMGLLTLGLVNLLGIPKKSTYLWMGGVWLFIFIGLGLLRGAL